MLGGELNAAGGSLEEPGARGPRSPEAVPVSQKDPMIGELF